MKNSRLLMTIILLFVFCLTANLCNFVSLSYGVYQEFWDPPLNTKLMREYDGYYLNGNFIYNGPYYEWYESGQIMTKRIYLWGCRNGVWESYWENGHVQTQESYGSGDIDSDGRNTGIWEYYYPDDRQRFHGEFDSLFNLPIGKWKYFKDYGSGETRIREIQYNTNIFVGFSLPTVIDIRDDSPLSIISQKLTVTNFIPQQGGTFKLEVPGAQKYERTTDEHLLSHGIGKDYIPPGYVTPAFINTYTFVHGIAHGPASLPFVYGEGNYGNGKECGIWTYGEDFGPCEDWHAPKRMFTIDWDNYHRTSYIAEDLSLPPSDMFNQIYDFFSIYNSFTSDFNTYFLNVGCATKNAEPKPITLRITNRSVDGDIPINGQITVDSPYFKIENDACSGNSIAPLQSCSFDVVLTPSIELYPDTCICRNEDENCFGEQYGTVFIPDPFSGASLLNWAPVTGCVKAPAFEIIDPQGKDKNTYPEFFKEFYYQSGDAQSVYDNMSKGGKNVDTVVADGVTKLLLRLDLPVNGQVDFHIVENQSGSLSRLLNDSGC